MLRHHNPPGSLGPRSHPWVNLRSVRHFKGHLLAILTMDLPVISDASTITAPRPTSRRTTTREAVRSGEIDKNLDIAKLPGGLNPHLSRLGPKLRRLSLLPYEIFSSALKPIATATLTLALYPESMSSSRCGERLVFSRLILHVLVTGLRACRHFSLTVSLLFYIASLKTQRACTCAKYTLRHMRPVTVKNLYFMLAASRNKGIELRSEILVD